MDKHHLLISGTGRAGTTFLVQLFTELGLDTGFANSRDGLHAGCNAGMEWSVDDLFKKKAPYVVKSPALSEHINEILGTPGLVVDLMIIPIRDLYASAESRRLNARQAGNAKTAGGLWLTRDPRKQEMALATQFHYLVHALVKHDVPMIWLDFPRCVKDAGYLYRKLQPVLPATDFPAFARAFKEVSRPELVHQFPAQAEKSSLLTRMNSWMWNLFARNESQS
jgi:hypothetical protein